MIGYGYSYFVSTILDTESGTAPVNTVAPVISGGTSVGSILSCTTGTWTGNPTPTYTYQWYRGVNPIGGATSSTYTLVAADVSNLIKCTVTATNTFGVASANSNSITATWEADAQAFITAASITDPTQQSAINNFVISYKTAGLWTLNKAVYLFVGGTSSTHKWNLKDPRDLDAAFRLLFNGGWTHSSTGALPNGTNAWADTKLVAQGTLGLNSTHVSVYSRSNIDRVAPSIGNVTGAASFETSMWLRAGNLTYLRVNNLTAVTQVNNDSRGLFIGNRNSSTQINLSIRGTQTTFTNASNSLSTNSYQLGGVSPNFFDSKELAFVSIGDGYTAQNMTDETTIVNAFQAALSRNV